MVHSVASWCDLDVPPWSIIKTFEKPRHFLANRWPGRAAGVQRADSLPCCDWNLSLAARVFPFRPARGGYRRISCVVSTPHSRLQLRLPQPEHPLSPKANLTQSATASASAEQARADGQGQLVDVADPTSPLSPTTTSPAAGTPLGGTSPTPNPSASLPPPTVESLTAEKQRLEAELDRATSTHFVDNIVGRSLTGGIFTAVLTSQVEESLHQKIESHVAEASEAAVAAIVPGVSAEDHDELRRQVGTPFMTHASFIRPRHSSPDARAKTASLLLSLPGPSRAARSE